MVIARVPRPRRRDLHRGGERGVARARESPQFNGRRRGITHDLHVRSLPPRHRHPRQTTTAPAAGATATAIALLISVLLLALFGVPVHLTRLAHDQFAAHQLAVLFAAVADLPVPIASRAHPERLAAGGAHAHPIRVRALVSHASALERARSGLDLGRPVRQLARCLRPLARRLGALHPGLQLWCVPAALSTRSRTRSRSA